MLFLASCQTSNSTIPSIISSRGNNAMYRSDYLCIGPEVTPQLSYMRYVGDWSFRLNERVAERR